MKRYTKMEYENPDEMTFGFSKHPVKTKNGLEIGAGYVNPIIKLDGHTKNAWAII